MSTISTNEPVFYIHDDSDSDAASASDDSLLEKSPTTKTKPKNNNNSNNSGLAREVARLQERCSALEAAVQSGAAQRDATVAKLNWLEHMVRALASVSSRTNPVYWNLAKREALPDDFDHAPLDAVARPRSQYEHAPRRDHHAFNRQPLPPPPPPLLELDDLPRDAYNRIGGRYDSASLLARVGAFLNESDRLLSRISSRLDERADEHEPHHFDDAELTPRAAAAPKAPSPVAVAAVAAPKAAAAPAAAAPASSSSLTAAEAAVAVARERERVRSGNIDEAAQMSRDLNKLLSKKRSGGGREQQQQQ